MRTPRVERTSSFRSGSFADDEEGRREETLFHRLLDQGDHHGAQTVFFAAMRRAHAVRAAREDAARRALLPSPLRTTWARLMEAGGRDAPPSSPAAAGSGASSSTEEVVRSGFVPYVLGTSADRAAEEAALPVMFAYLRGSFEWRKRNAGWNGSVHITTSWKDVEAYGKVLPFGAVGGLAAATHIMEPRGAGSGESDDPQAAAARARIWARILRRAMTAR